MARPISLEGFLDLSLLERDHGDVIERVEIARSCWRIAT